MHAPALEVIDVDGAIRETAAAAAGDTRAAFLAKAGLLGGGMIGASALLDPALAGAASKQGDIAILNFALTLEHLEATFYAEAKRMGALSGELQLFAAVVADTSARTSRPSRPRSAARRSASRSSTSRARRRTRPSSPRPPRSSRTRA